ncbi:MAG TPA: cytochrome b/b6 domain-containing protein [Nevskiaceae bacterium]|nr:cytochrome b/b6 domain-containing protein [Nevskiaceae bacterium]
MIKPSAKNEAARPRYAYVQRHTPLVRITHWVNFLCLVVLFMSGLAIFNGWPALYWGMRTHFAHPLLAFYSVQGSAGQPVGMTWLFGHQFVTAGWFGLSAGTGGHLVVRGFPAWATLPEPLNLALARRWHFFFAWIFFVNGLVYVANALVAHHFSRDLAPSRRELSHLGRSVFDHLRLRLPQGANGQRYNVLQKLSYIVVAFGLGPLAVATGLAMSPWIGTGYPWLVTLFGGRQSARTIHFVVAFALLAFFLVHLAMVLASGPLNQIRAMITGRYRVLNTNRKDPP